MSEPARVPVALGSRSYDILVGGGLLPRLAGHLAPVLRQRRVAILTDQTVAALHLPVVTRSLDEQAIAHDTVILPPGEQTKDFPHLERVVDALLEARVERGTTLLALGGGVIGDLGGFAASVLLRGIDFVQVPTTLLAQVDSSVGGKTGINTRHGKNLIGTFHQPRLVLADTDALSTLPRREMRAGYAEIVKYGLLGDAPFFAWLDNHGSAVVEGDSAALQKAIVASCTAKAAIVAADERESSLRALLNLGHTFAHALEAECGYGDELLHGEAVAIGMVMAFELSAELGFCSLEDAARVSRHLAMVGLPTTPAAIRNFDADRLIAHMRQDKKVRDGKLAFVLVRGIGEAFVATDVDPAAVHSLLQISLAA